MCFSLPYTKGCEKRCQFHVSDTTYLVCTQLLSLLFTLMWACDVDFVSVDVRSIFMLMGLSMSFCHLCCYCFFILFKKSMIRLSDFIYGLFLTERID